MEHITSTMIWSGVMTMIFMAFLFLFIFSRLSNRKPVPVSKYSWDEFMRDVESDVSLDAILEKARTRGGIPKRPRAAVADAPVAISPFILAPYIGTPYIGGTPNIGTPYSGMPHVGIGVPTVGGASSASPWQVTIIGDTTTFPADSGGMSSINGTTS